VVSAWPLFPGLALPIKILGINGSPRKAATDYTMREALAAAQGVTRVTTELISLCEKNITPCRHCDSCLKKNRHICEIYKEDDMNALLRLWLSADGYIVGSPVYSMGITPQLTAFFSRLRP
jgi:multimeric flavodoxin WrbA